LATCRLLPGLSLSPALRLLAALRRLLFLSLPAEGPFQTRIALLSLSVRRCSSVRSLVVSVSWHDRCSRVSPSLERDALPVSRIRFHESA